MTKHAFALCLAVTLSAAATSAGDDPEPKGKAVMPREIVVAGLQSGDGTYDAPTRITTQKQLAELVPDEQTRGAILKAVNFRKEHLLLFRWSGSGSGRIVPVQSKAGEANFEFTGAGLKIHVAHAKLFAVPARAKVKVTTR